jgi:hypothetical protein
MRWQLNGDWPVGPVLIPTGTVLSGVAGPDGELVEAPKWNNGSIALPMPMPINAMALDQEAALQTCKWFDQDLWHRLIFHRSLDRDAILAEAALRKRWPNGVPQTMSGPSIPKSDQRKDLEMAKSKPKPKSKPTRRKPTRKPVDHKDN